MSALLTEWFVGVVTLSWRVAWLVAAFLLLRRLIGGRVPAQCLFIGWIVIAVRLVLPFSVSTAWSPFNWTSDPMPGGPVSVLIAPLNIAAGHGEAGLSPVSLVTAPAQPGSVFPWLAAVWIVGAAWLATTRLVAAQRLFRSWRLAARPTEERVKMMVTAEAVSAGFEVGPMVWTSAAVPAPAISGLRRPTLWLPAGFAMQLDDVDLRFVLRHELAHWRRRDLWVQALLELARILHWWNPMVWLAVRAARADCETACDEFVMRRTSSAETTAYGTALLKVLGVVRVQTGSPAVLGVFENKKQLKRRILMISNYQAPSRGRTLVGAVAVMVLALAAVTREVHAQSAKPEVSPSVTTTAPVGWWKNGSKPASYVTGVDLTVGNPKPPSAYVKSIEPVTEGFGGMMQSFDASAYRGKRMRLRGLLKTQNAIQGACLWLRVDGGEDDRMLALDNMQNRPVKGTRDWTPCAVVIDVPVEAKTLNFGFFIMAEGQAWVSGLSFEEVGPEVASTAKQLPSKPVNLEFVPAKGS